MADYIDREKYCKNQCICNSNMCDKNTCSVFIAPAEEDVAPIIRGKWKKQGNEKECSNCKFIYYSNNDDFNYCPNCGAKMY